MHQIAPYLIIHVPNHKYSLPSQLHPHTYTAMVILAKYNPCCTFLPGTRIEPDNLTAAPKTPVSCSNPSLIYSEGHGRSRSLYTCLAEHLLALPWMQGSGKGVGKGEVAAHITLLGLCKITTPRTCGHVRRKGAYGEVVFTFCYTYVVYACSHTHTHIPARAKP